MSLKKTMLKETSSHYFTQTVLDNLIIFVSCNSQGFGEQTVYPNR